jgi:hypothetical protein
MKKKQLYAICMLALSILQLESCKKKDDYDKLLNEVPIQKEFATNSPLTKDITLQLLDKPNKWGNFLMTADLKGQLQSELFAYEVDKQKVVMRDDGKGADATKGDGIFSVFVNIDTNEVKDMVNEQNNSIKRSGALEANVGDVKNIIRFLKFDAKDSARSQASHKLLLNDPGIDFVNRFVKFDPRKPILLNPKDIFRDKLPIHIFPPFLCSPPPADLIPKSLMINDINVVEDLTRTWNPVAKTGNKTGAWTFNNIINQMVNSTGITATQFVLKWLQTWDADINLNGDVAVQRPQIDNLINTWKQRSLAHGLPADSLDMAEAPVKLLAIVNRVDLRENVGYSSTNAGEGRFVFCVLNSDATTVLISPERFTIIFEYGVNRAGCAVKDWGQQWYNLHTMTPGTPTYNSALQLITDQFVNANTGGSKPNGSSLNQIRTDEIALGSVWQLREFNIDATTHLLKLVTVKKTPRDGTNNSAFLASFINANCAPITDNNYTIPEIFSGQPLLGIKSDNTLSNPWNASPISCSAPTVVRQIFSINTCNACHGVETGTGFTHVNPTSFGSMAGLSGFLTGITLNDPVSGTSVSLADLDDRAVKLQRLVCQSCKIFGPLVFRPRNMVH